MELIHRCSTPSVSGETIRQLYGLQGKLVIGFVGWFRPWHRLELLLEIVHEEHLADQDVKLLLVGDGPAYEGLYSFAKKHNLLSTIIFTGPVKRDNIVAHIAAMDITVQPSATEYACPMKIFEYMGMGKCIVAPDQPNIREILQDGVNGYLFKPHNREHFKEVLLKAIRNPFERKTVGQQAHQTIHQQSYLWSANAKKSHKLDIWKCYSTKRRRYQREE